MVKMQGVFLLGTIKEINNENDVSYSVTIRNKGIYIKKTFKCKEDANLFVFYKERLIDNMESFDVDIKDRITLKQIFELKLEKYEGTSKNIFTMSLKRLNDFFGEDSFYQNISYDQWKDFYKNISVSNVVHGGSSNGKTKKSERIISLKTIRNMFSYASSCISYCISIGINLENHPQKIITSIIAPQIKNKSDSRIQ